MKSVMMILCLLVMALAGCVETDLGEAPLLCNQGDPRCPEGYVCSRVDNADVCVREGSATSLTGTEDGGPAESD